MVRSVLLFDDKRPYAQSMKTKAIFLMLSLLVLSATAAPKPPHVDPDAQRLIETSKKEEPAPSPDAASVVKKICTNRSGIKYREGDTGYSSCLNDTPVETSQNVEEVKTGSSRGVEFSSEE